MPGYHPNNPNRKAVDAFKRRWFRGGVAPVGATLTLPDCGQVYEVVRRRSIKVRGRPTAGYQFASDCRACGTRFYFSMPFRFNTLLRRCPNCRGGPRIRFSSPSTVWLPSQRERNRQIVALLREHGGRMTHEHLFAQMLLLYAGTPKDYVRESIQKLINRNRLPLSVTVTQEHFILDPPP